MISPKYDVVVAGAGIIGLSVAYYLKKKGCDRVLVLEKEESWITGSTPRANGGFRQQFSTPVNIQMSRLSIPVFSSFEKEFGNDIAFAQHGYLFLTGQKRGVEGLAKNRELQRSHGIEVAWLEPDAVSRLAPYVRCDDLKGGNFCARDGSADAYSIAQGFGEAARRLGAEIRLQEPVIGILQGEGGRIQGVRTPRGTYRAPVLVNAVGPFARNLASLVGIDLPVEPVRRMLVMTELFDRIPDGIPMVVDLDTGFLMRKESGRVLMGWSDPDEPPGFNLAFDPAIIDIVAEKAVHRVPVLEAVRINTRKSWAGLYAETPDHHCILGEVTRVPGFFLANGFSGHGMMHSPAIGMLLSDLILQEHTDLLDVHPLRFSRFEEGDLIHEAVVI